ncbi:MAG: patatin-like phospholipase family protein [Dechloromonas sp.]|nr:patatin-like phospholipase family protein [Dechloromonas sp.]
MAKESTRPLNLALQGGGAHGAFTWGVLDALLADERFTFEGISGTSAGAMNAVCLAYGLLHGGRLGARQVLNEFWTSVAREAPFNTQARGPNMAPALKMMLPWTAHLSPEQLNPLDLNPLRDILDRLINFPALQRHAQPQLFIAATQANSGKLRIFQTAELTLDALLASACLPTLHRSILIDGEPYWDGGYSANPAIFPLVHDCHCADILLVLLTPLRYQATPLSAVDIRQRLNELAFNATFLREMRMFAHLRDEAGRPWLPDWLMARWPIAPLEQRLRTIRFHAITADTVLGPLPAESKLAVNLPFFENLRDQGRAHARQWLDESAAAIGQRPTLDIGALFY